MEERTYFAVLADQSRQTVSELCEEFEISRKTGYEWLRRYRALGVAGMWELNCRPRICSHRTPAGVVKQVMADANRVSVSCAAHERDAVMIVGVSRRKIDLGVG